MQQNASLRQLDRKCCRMRALAGTISNRAIRHEPDIPTTSTITSSRVAPPRDITFVCIGNTYGKSVDGDFSRFREMKNVFVAIIQVAPRIDRLEVPFGECAAILEFKRNRLHPMDRILQGEQTSGSAAARARRAMSGRHLQRQDLETAILRVSRLDELPPPKFHSMPDSRFLSDGHHNFDRQYRDCRAVT